MRNQALMPRHTRRTYVFRLAKRALVGFDYVVSILCVHHFPPQTKVGIYRSFRRSLKVGGMYIEGDQMTRGTAGSEDHELFEHWIAKLSGGRQYEWNFDVTLNAETNRSLLLDAGFGDVEGPWFVGDGAVMTATGT